MNEKISEELFVTKEKLSDLAMSIKRFGNQIKATIGYCFFKAFISMIVKGRPEKFADISI